jgi:O-antigen/teichoic acid export membrane protein
MEKKIDRKKILLKNVSFGVIYKVINMGIVFTTIPLLLNYLDKELYGIWVTIFSLVNIALFIDGGIGNGLKTKLSKSLSQNNFKISNNYIATAYLSVSLISFIILIIGFLLIFNLNLKEIFNASLSTIELQKILSLTLVLVMAGFVLNLYKSLYYANQEASKVELAALIYQILILFSIFILLNFFTKDLFLIALIYGGSNILVSSIFTVLFFRKNKKITFSITFFDKKIINDLIGLSLSFFIIQLCLIVVFTSDNLIITNLISPVEVTTYDVVYKLFQVIVTFSVILQDSFWALYTDAYEKKDYKWIKQTLLRLNKLFIAFSFLVVFMYFTAKPIIKIWTQKNLEISDNLILFMSIYVLVRAYGIIYMNFLNSIGKINLQMWLFIFGAIINIPVSIYFVKYLNLGSSGVILGTIFSLLGLTLILPLQTFKILKNKND